MSDQPLFYRTAASADWTRAKRQAVIEQLLDRVRFHQKTLVPFDEVRTRLKLRNRHYRGLQDVPLGKIVGSVGRYKDFTRTFLPRSDDIRQRWQRVSTMMIATGLPPVQLYKVGDAYFVADGNHRVSVARTQGAKTIEAEVWEYTTSVPLGDDVTLDTVLLEEQRLDFLEQTGLDKLRPDHNIRFTVPGRYIEIEYQIALYQKAIEQIDGQPCPHDQVVVDWYDMVYQPTVQIIREEDILQYFPGRTEADLFAWVCRHRHRLSTKYGLSVKVQDVTRRVQGRGPLAWLRRLLAKTEV